MEFVVAQVEGGVDRAEGLERVGHLLFFAIVVDAGTAVHDQTVGGHTSEARTLQSMTKKQTASAFAGSR